MQGKFLAIALTGFWLCGAAMAANSVETIDGATRTDTVTANTDDTSNAAVDFVITSSGLTDGNLTVVSSGAGTSTTWNAGSITLTSDDTTQKGVFILDGTNEITAKLSGGVTIGGNGTVGGEMRVTGTKGELDAARGMLITDMGKLVIDTNAALSAAGTAVTVNSSLPGSASAIDLGTGGKLTVRSLNLQAGVLEFGAANSSVVINADAMVGGYKADAASGYSAASLVLNGAGTTTFKAGLTVGEGGTIVSAGTGGVFSLGSGKTLTLADGTLQAVGGGVLTANVDKIVVDGSAESVIDVSADNIIFNQANGTATSHSDGTTLTVKSDLTIKGGNTVTFHSYAQSEGTVATPDAGNLHILSTDSAATVSGGTFAAGATFEGGVAFSGTAVLKGTGQTITGGGTGNEFSLGAKTEINLVDGKLTLANVEELKIGGIIRFGGTATAANTLTVDGKAVFVTGSDIKLTTDFARAVTASATATAANTLIATGAAGYLTTGLAGEALTSDNFLLGHFTLKDDGQYLFVSEADRLGLALDGSAADYALAERLISNRYGPGVTNGFAANIYKSVVDPSAPAPYDRLLPGADVVVGSGSPQARSYEMNLANLTDFATGGQGADDSLSALYNGLNNSGVADVAMATAEATAVRARDRLRKIGETRAALRETIGSDSALAASILNSEVENRLWVGGFGMWEDADARNGLGGYRYESAGFVGGYDYACGPLSVGGAFAYATGDFMDKTALRHDSDIASYSTILHAAYYAPEGFFAIASGSYTFSRNDINELRSNPSIAAGQSWNQAEYNSNTWRASIEAGYDFRPASCVTITPSVGFTYVGVNLTDHHERLGGVVAGRVSGVDTYGAYVPVRLEVGYDIPTGSESHLRLTARGGYAYNFNKDGIDGEFALSGFSNAATHKVVGRKPSRHQYNGGVGFRFVTGQFDIGMNYDYSGRADYSAHQVTATAGFRF